jgi:hypothetical protein
MPVIFRPAPWGKQPFGAFPSLNRSSPLARGLESLLIPGVPYDIVSGKPVSFAGQVYTAVGPVFGGYRATAMSVTFDIPTSDRLRKGTIASLGTYQAYGSSAWAGRVQILHYDGGTGWPGDLQRAVIMNWDSGGGAWQIGYGIENFASGTSGPFGSYLDNVHAADMFYAITYDATSNINGTAYANYWSGALGVSGSGAWPTGYVRLFSVGAQDENHQSAIGAAWSRILSAEELRLFRYKPWQLLV